MLPAPFLPADAAHAALFHVRLQNPYKSRSLCALWILLSCAFGFAPSTLAQPTPYGGSPVSVAAQGPTKVEAENYDLGGEGVAYHDVDNGGSTTYRSDNIGVYTDNYASNGFAVGYAQAGEWDGYTLNVAAAGFYALTAHLACQVGDGTFHLEFGPVGQVGGAGVIRSGEFTVVSTGSWGSYQDISVPTVNLPAGPLWMRFVLDGGGNGSGPYAANFDFFSLTSVAAKNLTPYGGTAVTVAASGPTKVEAENYDLGGEGLAYHDINNGGQTSYRSDNIGVYAGGNASNSYAVGWVQPGEWEGYTLNVAAAGTYTLAASASSPTSGGTFHLEFGPIGGTGVIKSGEFTIANTGGWVNYQTFTVPSVNLPAGPLWMRLIIDSSSPNVGNLDCFTLTPTGPAQPTGLAASAGSGQIILAWNASFGAASYNLYRSTTAGGEGTTPYKKGLSGTSYTDTSVVPGTPYYYTVTAVNLAGESGPSNEASATARPATSPDFALTVNPSLNIVKGSAGTLDVNIASINNFIGTVNLSISGLPTGVTAAFSPTTVAGSGGSTLTLTTNATIVTPGSATLTVTGASSPSGPTHSQTLTLTITGAGGNLASGPVWLTDIYLPKTLRIEWLPQSYQYNSYVVTRSGGGASSGTTTGNTFWNDAFDFVFQTPYTYHVVDNWTADRYWDSTNQVWIYPGGQVDLGSLTVTPMQQLVTENQVVDARYDPRYSVWTFVNHKFGTTTYRGGLFAGYNADNSQVGHSYLKFLLPAPASGQTVLPVASVNAWFTRNYDLTGSPNPDSVGVACQSVPSYWNAKSITWANAPAFSSSQTAQIFSGTPQTPPWVHWKMGVDVAAFLSAGGGPYSVALSGTQEPIVGGAGPTSGSASGWVYFAKKEYATGQPATLLYALSGAGASAHAARPALQAAAKKTFQAGAKKERRTSTQKKR